MEEQTDWIKAQDRLIEYKRSLRASVQRAGIKLVAGDLKLEASALGHQLSHWDSRKQPSALCAVRQLWSDPQHAGEVLGQIGKVVISPPRLSPEDALRVLVAKASKGFVSSQEAAEVLAQTDLGGVR